MLRCACVNKLLTSDFESFRQMLTDCPWESASVYEMLFIWPYNARRVCVQA